MKIRWAPAALILASIVVVASACSNDDGIEDPPVAPTIKLSPATEEPAPLQSQTPPSYPDWDKDFADLPPESDGSAA